MIPTSPRWRLFLPLLVVALGLPLAARQEDEASLRARAQAALAPVDGTLSLPGLQARVEVIRDRWGVPHIYATTLEDLFFSQGFVAAQDRLWQLELWRRTAEGSLAEVLGEPALDRDTFARLLRYRGDMDAEWRAYSPDTKRIVDAFVRGVNAQVAWVGAHPDKLPIEFQLTGLTPRPWTPELVLSRMAGYVMTRNASTEVQRAVMARTLGIARVADFMPPDPVVPVTVPPGLDLADITADVLRIARSANDPVDFREAPAKAADASVMPAFGFAGPRRPSRRDPMREAGDALQALARLDDGYSTVGSNNWVLSGKLTASGRPLLANDPHRPLPLPSLRYTVHLNGPGWNVIGAGEPALPGVAAGHNDRVGFGFTIVGIDQQDLYVEQLNPANPSEYRYKGKWETMRVERERIAVKGRPPVDVELRFTRHGPVVHVDAARQRAYALRWVGMEPGTAGYLASLSMNIARSWPEFLAAVERWKVPSENLIYADVDGNIGWVAAGMAPIRRNWNGLLPVPGHDGTYEWDGFLPMKDLPQAFNPASGFVATANHNILPPGYPHMLGYEWSSPNRYQRILEVLSARKGGFTRADSEALQHDDVSVTARGIVEALRVASSTIKPPTADLAFAVRMLTSWDGRLAKESAPAALYQLWLPHLQKAVGEHLAKQRQLPAGVAAPAISLERVTQQLAAPSPALLALLIGTPLQAAWDEARTRMGTDPGAWAWGKLHYAEFLHPLATTPARAAVMNLPRVPRGGDGTTPFATSGGMRQTGGASFREVLDVGNWDESTTINVPGISGQPTSPHYADLLPLWAAGQYHPMVFSREAVEANAKARLVLMPASASAASEAPDATRPRQAASTAPVLPDFVGTLVNFDDRGPHPAVCALDPAGGQQQIGARAVPNTYVWVIDGQQIRQLGTTPGSCDPAWSPGGDRLAVVQTNGLWTYSPTLEDPQQIADAHLPVEPKHATDYTAFRLPRWSADGRFIAALVTNGATTWVEVFENRTGRRAFKSEPNVDAFTWDEAAATLRVGGRPIPIR